MTPDERIRQLENRLVRLERVMKVKGNMVTFTVPVKMMKSILMTQAEILAGYGDPTNVVQAPIGSMYLRLDGGGGSTLYMKEAAAISGWSTTA